MRNLIVITFLILLFSISWVPVDSQPDKVVEETKTLIQNLDQLEKEHRYEDAIPYAKKLLEIFEKHLEKDDPNITMFINRFATIYLNAGRYAEAEPLFKRSLEIYEKAFGKEHPDSRTSVLGLIVLYSKTNRYEEAASYAERLLIINERILGEDDSNLLTPLGFLTVIYQKTGKYQEAIPYAKRFLEINETAFGKDHINVATALMNLAELYRKTSRFPEAETLYKRSLEIKEKALSGNHPEVAVINNNLALLYTQMKRYPEAEPLYKKSIEINENALGKDHPGLAITLSNLAELYRQTFRFAESEMLYKRSLEIKEKALGRDHPEVAIILNNLALLYEGTDRYTEAELSLKRSLEINEKVLGRDHPEVATNLNNLAMLYLNIGRFAEAEPLYKRSLEIRERVSGKEHPDYATGLNNLALFYINTGRYAEAEVLSKKSLEINEKVLGKDSFEVTVGLDYLALAYAETGRYDEAEPLLKRSIGIKERLLEKDPVGIRGPLANSLATSLNNMGALYTSTERYLEAELLLKKSLEINEKIFGKDHLAVARGLENLAFNYGKTAVIHGDTGKYSDVEALLRRALDIRERVQGKYHPDVGLARNGMAILYAFTKRHFESHRMFVDAITIAEKKREDIFLVLSEKQKLHYMEQNNWNIHGFIIHAAQHMKGNNLAVAETFDSWLKWKGAVMETQGRYIDAVTRSENLDIQKKFEELNKTRHEIARLQISGPGKMKIEEYQKRLEDLEKKKETLEAELTRLSKDFAFEKMVGRADIKKITEILLKSDKTSVYIDFAHVTMRVWKGEKPLGVRYLVFLFLPDKKPIVKLIDLSDAEGVDKHIKAYLEEMRRAKEFRDLPRERILKAEAKSLYKLLLKPIEKEIKGKKHLYISPDGNLNLIPFEVLITSEGKYLMEDYTITYIAAGRDIMRFMDETVAKGDPLIMADPDYDMGLKEKTQVVKAMGVIETRGPAPATRDAKDLRFKRLPDTKQEADAIEKCLGESQNINVRNYQDKQALEEVLMIVKQPKILHLATHGYFLKDEEVKHQPKMGFIFQERERMADIGIENPMLRSGIVLAGVNASLKEGKGDGLVSAEKILGLKLKGTDLVVLSACETGTGDVKSGEGVFGLKRSFILSGAKTVVMSLWSIPSKETTELMIDFYSLMAKGKSKADSFREARLNLMKKKPNPFYWGAFVMVGNPN